MIGRFDGRTREEQLYLIRETVHAGSYRVDPEKVAMAMLISAQGFWPNHKRMGNAPAPLDSHDMPQARRHVWPRRGSLGLESSVRLHRRNFKT